MLVFLWFSEALKVEGLAKPWALRLLCCGTSSISRYGRSLSLTKPIICRLCWDDWVQKHDPLMIHWSYSTGSWFHVFTSTRLLSSLLIGHCLMTVILFLVCNSLSLSLPPLLLYLSVFIYRCHESIVAHWPAQFLFDFCSMTIYLHVCMFLFCNSFCPSLLTFTQSTISRSVSLYDPYDLALLRRSSC